jgi:adenosylhomocysteinase
MAEDRAFQAEQEVGRINAFFPILPQLGNHWAASRPWEGATIGMNLHVTPITAALVRELLLGGATCIVSAANPGTTDPGSVELLRAQGVEVYTGGDLEDRHLQLLDHGPSLLVDAGFDLTSTLLDKRKNLVSRVKGAVEISRTGITRLRARGQVPFPVVNVNDGRLKDAVENRHGVGEGVWQAVSLLTGMHLSGRRVAVLGYGPVGRGLAAYARAAGCAVEVVETDPIRQLFAHYDGYPTPALDDALSRVRIAVTATGHKQALTLENLERARDGVVLLKAGHGGDEIDVVGIQRAAVRQDNVADQVVRYRLENGNRITVLGGGNPLNIVLNSGSPEPVLLHFAVVGLTLERIAGGLRLPTGEVVVPDEIESRAAALALEAVHFAAG